MVKPTSSDRVKNFARDTVITYDCFDVSKAISQMTKCRIPWDEVRTTMNEVIVGLRAHGVLPPETCRQVLQRVDGVNQSLQALIQLLKNFEESYGW
jgi:hypothetical protein